MFVDDSGIYDIYDIWDIMGYHVIFDKFSVIYICTWDITITYYSQL